jgi:hypothetical protein
MSSLLKDAQCAAKEGLEYASETAEDALGSAKKRLEYASEKAEDALGSAKKGLEYASEKAEDALGSAKKGAESVKGAAERSGASLLGAGLKGLSAAATIVTMLRRFDLDNGLSWFGLARRRSPLVTVAFLGTGILIGTGLGLLIAPVSGAEARRTLRERFDDYMQRGARAVHLGERELERLEHEAEEIAARAVSEVKKVTTIPAADPSNGRLTPNEMRS